MTSKGEKMNKELQNIRDEIIHNEIVSYNSLLLRFKANLDLIIQFKKLIAEDEKIDDHELIIKYIKLQSVEDRIEILQEVSNLYRERLLIYQNQISKAYILAQETFLCITQNDKRFFRKGPEKTSADVIAEQLNNYLTTFYPKHFTDEINGEIVYIKLDDKAIYKPYASLQEEVELPLIKVTSLAPGTGAGLRRRDRYCLTKEGLDLLIPRLKTVLQDQLDNLLYQI